MMEIPLHCMQIDLEMYFFLSTKHGNHKSIKIYEESNINLNIVKNLSRAIFNLSFIFLSKYQFQILIDDDY